jgi:Fe-Mn family superoxide dismutase
MLTTASKMFGAGWVWLVLDQNKHLRIICTYNAGTPYGAAFRRQETDMNTNLKLGTPPPSIDDMTNTAKRASQGALATNWAMPLLNLNVWEHSWLEDFGVMGKDKYLEALWCRIDWKVVAGRCGSLGGYINAGGLYYS